MLSVQAGSAYPTHKTYGPSMCTKCPPCSQKREYRHPEFVRRGDVNQNKNGSRQRVLPPSLPLYITSVPVWVAVGALPQFHGRTLCLTDIIITLRCDRLIRIPLSVRTVIRIELESTRPQKKNRGVSRPRDRAPLKKTPNKRHLYRRLHADEKYRIKTTYGREVPPIFTSGSKPVARMTLYLTDKDRFGDFFVPA